MAPYGACEVAQSTARSNAQFGAELFRKGFRRKNKHDRNCCRRKKHARRCFRRKNKCSSSVFERSVASKEKEACSSIDFKRSVASKHTRAVLSSAQWPLRRSKKQARAVISSAQRSKSRLEQ